MPRTRGRAPAGGRADALSREIVVGAAVALLDEHGERGLTFRLLAERLNTGAGALYWHVANKDELVALAADQVLGQALAADAGCAGCAGGAGCAGVADADADAGDGGDAGDEACAGDVADAGEEGVAGDVADAGDEGCAGVAGDVADAGVAGVAGDAGVAGVAADAGDADADADADDDAGDGGDAGDAGDVGCAGDAAGTGLRALAIAVFDALDQHPWAASHVTAPATLANTLRLLDRIGTLVTRTGLPAERHFAVATAIFTYITGVSAQIIAPAVTVAPTTSRDAYLAKAAEHWERLDPAEYPFLTRTTITADLRDHDDRDQFTTGLDLLLDGLCGPTAPPGYG